MTPTEREEAQRLRERAATLTEENVRLQQQTELLIAENASLRARINDVRWVTAHLVRLRNRLYGIRGLGVAFATGAAAMLALAASSPWDDQIFNGVRREMLPALTTRGAPVPEQPVAPGRPPTSPASRPASPRRPRPSGTPAPSLPLPVSLPVSPPAVPVPSLPLPTPLPLPGPSLSLPVPTPSLP